LAYDLQRTRGTKVLKQETIESLGLFNVSEEGDLIETSAYRTF
jgi:hypothetical protein